MASQPSTVPKSVLIINPNTTTEMTDALKPLVDSLKITTTKFTYFTAPTGVPSINNEDDAAISADHCLPHLRLLYGAFDGFLVCCYSKHPLVGRLQTELAEKNSTAAVTGIFEASLVDALNKPGHFGIVSTGKQWQEILGDAVRHDLGKEKTEARYAGTETTGLNANELHSAPPEEVAARMKAATKRLLAKDAIAICLGCAGMAGMDSTVRQACIEALGEEKGKEIRIIDGVLSGVRQLRGEL